MPDTLTQFARRALADMIGLYYDGGLSNATKETIIELYDALKEKGEDVSDYQDDYRSIIEDIGEG